MNAYHRCYAEISLGAIAHNLEEVRRKIGPKVKLLAVVKANAYGHGAVKVGQFLQDKVDYFAVAALEEAMELREAGIKTPILILGYTSPSQYDDLVGLGVTQTIYSLEDAQTLSETAKRLSKKAKIHVALDTGMTRIGFQVRSDEADRIAAVADLEQLELEGVFSHFSQADQADKTFCRVQLAKFEEMLSMLADRGVRIPIRHICNSAGIMEFDDYRYEMVRSGIVTYGLYPSAEVSVERLDLIPALAWKTHVIHVKDVEPGRSVSYGGTFVTEKPVTRIATISAGYADGYPRALSGKGRVLIHGEYAPILGRICMDQIMVDVTDIPAVQVEDVVILIGKDGDREIPIEEVADPAGRFNYEMACNIEGRVARIYKD